jgi:hypothetical protein
MPPQGDIWDDTPAETAPTVTTIREEAVLWDDTPPSELPKILTIEEYILAQELRIRDENARAERRLRDFATNIITRVFTIANIVMLAAVAVASAADYYFIEQKFISPKERLIDSRVVMSLVGATTVQLGAIMVTIYRYIFPSSRGGISASSASQRNSGNRSPSPRAASRSNRSRGPASET